MDAVTESTVLIVDDVVGNRLILKKVLADYTTVEAESGEEALQAVGTSRPDIILLDIQMPGLDGYEVCRRLKASPDTAAIPIIFITGAEGPGLAGRCFEVGAVDFVTKPFDLQEIRARVETHLRLKRTSETLQLQNRRLEKTILEQRLNLRLAHQVLDLVDFPPSRYTRLKDDLHLFVRVLSRPCHEEGGDHFLIKSRSLPNGGEKTLISLKDQSGHSVNCILRSIITDLFHNSVLKHNADSTLCDAVKTLNDAICGTGLFAGDDFFTALFLELNHERLELDYIAAGHPSFFLIRTGQIHRFPAAGGDGMNLPLGFQEGIDFSCGTLALEEDDIIVMYTDGLVELPMSFGEKALRWQELEELLSGMVAEDVAPSLATIISKLPEEVMARGGLHGNGNHEDELHDDVTVLGLQVTRLKSNSWHQLIPSDFGSIDALIEEAYQWVVKKMSRCDLTPDAFGLRTALNEGVLNAWKHGNQCASELPIQLGWDDGNDFSVFIRDQGQGFDTEAVHNPATLAYRTKESGRGIFCMKKYADFVGWLDDGATLVLSFHKERHIWELGKPSSACRVDLWRGPFPRM